LFEDKEVELNDKKEDEADEAVVEKQEKKKNKYRKDKPWDNDSIDHWNVPEWNDEEAKGGHFLEESSFATLFPQYREKYLREVWPEVTRCLGKYGVGCELDLVEGSMMVKTTRKTRDPFIILKSRDLIKLLARSVQLPQAMRVLEDEIYMDIVKIGSMVRNKERFVKRRQRLIGPNSSTLKAIELLTECYMLVQGNTVSLVGKHKGLKSARKIVEDCMKNIHPIYNIKELMIRRELAKDPELAEENWERFLPQFKKRAAKKKKKVSTKKEYTPFPPEPTPRKIDLQLESGEYFLTDHAKKEKKKEKEQEAQAAKAQERQKDRAKSFQAPKEADHGSGPAAAAPEDAAVIAGRIKKAKPKRKAENEAVDDSAFVDKNQKNKKKKKRET